MRLRTLSDRWCSLGLLVVACGGLVLFLVLALCSWALCVLTSVVVHVLERAFVCAVGDRSARCDDQSNRNGQGRTGTHLLDRPLDEECDGDARERRRDRPEENDQARPDATTAVCVCIGGLMTRKRGGPQRVPSQVRVCLRFACVWKSACVRDVCTCTCVRARVRCAFGFWEMFAKILEGY